MWISPTDPDPRPTPFDWLVLLFCVAAIAVVALHSCAARAATPPAEPDCRRLLHLIHDTRMRAGDRDLGIHDMRGGGAQLDYVNDTTGLFHEYVLLADYRKLISSPKQPLSVYGKCVIYQAGKPPTPATVYVFSWLRA